MSKLKTLTQTMQDRLEEQLIRHEAIRFFPYKDTVGKWTIGVGRNLDDRGITRDEAMLMLSNDIAIAHLDAERFVGAKIFHELNEARQMVLIDMAFNLGYDRLCGFKRLRKALGKHNYDEAEAEMEDSRWCRQVGKRCTNLRRMMRTGDYSR